MTDIERDCPTCEGTGVVVDHDNVTADYEPTMGCPGPCGGTGKVVSASAHRGAVNLLREALGELEGMDMRIDQEFGVGPYEEADIIGKVRAFLLAGQRGRST